MYACLFLLLCILQYTVMMTDLMPLTPQIEIYNKFSRFHFNTHDRLFGRHHFWISEQYSEISWKHQQGFHFINDYKLFHFYQFSIKDTEINNSLYHYIFMVMTINFFWQWDLKYETIIPHYKTTNNLPLVATLQAALTTILMITY